MPYFPPGGGGGAHASSHQNGGGDEVDATGLTGAASAAPVSYARIGACDPIALTTTVQVTLPFTNQTTLADTDSYVDEPNDCMAITAAVDVGVFSGVATVDLTSSSAFIAGEDIIVRFDGITLSGIQEGVRVPLVPGRQVAQVTIPFGPVPLEDGDTVGVRVEVTSAATGLSGSLGAFSIRRDGDDTP